MEADADVLESMMTGVQQLGPIELSGFRDFDAASMVVLKKIVGNYARKFTDHFNGFEKLCVSMKPVHQSQKADHAVFELHCRVLAQGRVFASHFSDRNVFLALDKALKRVEAEVKV